MAKAKPKAKLGRPTLYKAAFDEQLVKMGKEGFAICEVCDYWDISKDTFYRWLKENTLFSDAYKRYRQSRDSWHMRLHKEIAATSPMKKNATAAIFLSKRACGWSEDNLGDEAPPEDIEGMDFED